MRVNALAAPLICGLLLTSTVSAETPLTLQQWVGKQIFFDVNLSANRNQACADCHGPEVGWSGPDAAVNLRGAVYEGSLPGAFGNRKPTTSAYAILAPRFRYDPSAEGFVGGAFWDGRATGWKLGNPAAESGVCRPRPGRLSAYLGRYL
jgi:cytochrome c peroxidase